MTERSGRLRLSALIPTRGRPDLVAGCVLALLAQDDPVEEIIVVDQSDDDATAHALAAFSDVRRIASSERGLSAAHNLALAHARGDLFAFVDDDCWALPHWARGLRAAATRFPGAAAIFGSMLRPGGGREDEIDVSTIEFPTTAEHQGRGIPHRVGFGGNMALTRRAIDLLGPSPFDTRLGPGASLPGADDMDFIYRLLRAGGRIVSSPEAPVEHHQWRGSDVMPNHFYGYSKSSGAYAAGHLFSRDLFALVLIADLFYSDARFLASGVRRRSRLRLAVGAARIRGTIRGLGLGPALARGRVTSRSHSGVRNRSRSSVGR